MENFAISSDLIRGHIDTIILKSLFDGDKFAQEISNYIEEKSNKNYEVKQATLYSALKRLESSKYVKSYWQDVDCGGRRKIFNLTEKGKNYAESQLDNWDYSRDVINTLVDDKLNNKNNSNIIDNSKKIASTPIYIVKNNDNNTNKDNNIINKVSNANYISNNQNIKQKSSDFDRDYTRNNEYNKINYKEVLSDLFSKPLKVEQNKNETNTQNISEEKADNINNVNYVDSILKKEPETTITLNEIDNELNIQKIKSGKIDFTDLIEKAENEGYKIRVSSSNKSKIHKGEILINKVNMLSSLAIFIIALIEILIINFTVSTKLSPIYYYGSILVFAMFPIISIFKYVSKPDKIVFTFNHSILLTGIIVGFNLFLIIAAYNLLSETNFNSISELTLKVISPILFILDIIVFLICRNILSKSKQCLSK